MEETKQKRYRRTKAEITEDIRRAAEEQVMEKGFSSSIVTEVIKKAKIEPPVFYNRYKDLNEFFSEFVKECDYWFSDIVENASKSASSKEQYSMLLKGVLHSLKKKSIMLELLRWEVTEKNDITKRTATLREMFTMPLTENYRKMFEKTDVDFVALSSLIIGGIYYLCLHREVSAFCGIDMKTEEGVERVSKTLERFTDIMFAFLENKS